MNETVVVLDFGGQYDQLIARRVRENGVYCEVVPYTVPLEEIMEKKPVGIILTGGPKSAYLQESPHTPPALFGMGVPVLGICYGAQLMAHQLGGKVEGADAGEYGKAEVQIRPSSKIFNEVPSRFTSWMSHSDRITEVPDGFIVTGRTANCPVAAMEDEARKLYAVQFHPEVEHTEHGRDILRNFLLKVCGCACDWNMGSFVERTVAELKEKIGDRKVLLGLSGGVDSSVAAVLISRAIGKNLTCVFIDHGLLRENEAEEVEAVFGADGPYELTFVKVDAHERFYEKLAGVTDPIEKRKIIGEEFIRCFEEEARKLGKVECFAQGTIYPDVIESGHGDAAVIKPHHNVGGLPERMDFEEIIEPLRQLFKDEVREVGRVLGIPEKLIMRQPFPGPGLAIRIIGEITPEKLAIVRRADAIYREEVDAAGLAKLPDQYFAALTNMRSIGVMGDSRTYDYALVLRAVETTDFMTVEATPSRYFSTVRLSSAT